MSNDTNEQECAVTTSRALILGGTGLVGRAAARRLLASGWQVDVTGRDPHHLPADVAKAGGVFVAAQRDDAAALRTAMGGGVDLLVDCICYTAAEATLLLPLMRDAGSTVMISSKAVYVDAAGNHTNSDVAPHFDGPIRETQPTMAASDIDYNTREGYGANKVAAEQVLLASGLPVSVLRPSKIHGEGAARPREWMFVKRVLDRRTAVFLAHRGEGVDHTTAAVNLAALIETCAATPGRRILNSADPDSPNGLQIARAIARVLDHDWEEILLDDDADPALGVHPWDAAHPIVLDMTAAGGLGYEPVGDYATTVADAVTWLVSAANGGDGADQIPGADDEFFAPLLDYDAEDRYLAAR
jgi:nucleoside-diphosphate-sugar epimerase